MPDAPPRCGHVALAGAPNAGKSSLLNALVGQHLAIVSPRPQATRLPVVGLRTDAAVQYIFHDLPGLLDPKYLMQSRMRYVALETLKTADLVLYLHPAPESPAPEFQAAAQLDQPPRAPVRLVYTKGDLVSRERREELAREAPVISVLEGSGLDPLLAGVAAALPQRPFEFDPDDVGTQPLRFFVVEYLREAAFDLLSEEVPYAFTAQVEEFREDEDPVYIRVTLYVERDTQKAILIGKGGQTIKAIGQHARNRLENLLGSRVYLDTWVKVLPNWRKSAAALSRFGFPEEPLSPS